MNNKTARSVLAKIYGDGCMFQKARIAERIEQMGGIKTYKHYVEETHYKLKKVKHLEKNMTYHHLVHSSDGGKTSVRNGAIVNELAHRYLHSLPRDEEEIINNMLRQYKHEFELAGGIIVPTEKGIDIPETVVVPVKFDFENEEDYISIPAYDNVPTKKKPNEKKKKEKYNRSKEKEDLQNEINNYYNSLDEDDYEIY